MWMKSKDTYINKHKYNQKEEAAKPDHKQFQESYK